MPHSELRESGYTVILIQASALDRLMRSVQEFLDSRSWHSERCVSVSHAVGHEVSDPPGYPAMYTAMITIAALKRDYNSK